MERFNKEREGEIWAIGGGKGGTGKTFISSSVGTYLARKGKRVILIDVDIGGANLHSFLGINSPKKSLTNFFELGSPLNKLRIRTGIENMSLITGDIHSLASDSIKFTQKLKLFRHIMKLDSQYIVVDLGGGSHNNIIDTFLMADRMIVVLVPEIIAIENAYHFIKNTYFRKLRMSLRAYGFREIVDHIWKRRKSYKVNNLKELIDCLKNTFSYIGDILDKELSNFNIYIVLNMVRSTEDIFIGASMKSVLMKFLGINSQYIGYIEYDDSVWRSVRNKRPFMLTYPSSPCAEEIEAFTENLIQEKEIRLPKV